MRYSTAMILAAMSIGEAVAGPTHAHLHRKVHEKKDVEWSNLDWDAMGINWSSAYEAGKTSKTAAAAPVATTSAQKAPAPATVTPAPAKTTASSSVADDVKSVVNELFDGVIGVSNSRTTFGQSTASSGQAGDFYTGNTGSPYGSNIIKVDSTSGYDFTAKFINTQSSSITVNCWNKVGSDGQPLSGSALAPKDTSLTFSLGPGASQIVAFQDNSQVGCAQACSSIAESGAFATSWFEGNLASGGSGYDLSAIMNAGGNNYDMSITSVEAPDCTSDMTQNYWLTATEPIGNSDGSCYIAQSTATLTVKMGGTV